MLNIAICDDDDLIAHQIESVLHNIGDEENCRLPRLLTQQGLTTIERVNNAG